MKPASGLRIRSAAAIALVCGFAALAFAQYRGRVSAQYEHEMQDPVEDPPDADRKGEFALGRLRYRSPMDRGGFGYSRWGIDANKGDRIFIGLLKRLTRIDVSPVETIIDVEDDEMFNHPLMVAISVGDWQLSQGHADRLRKYFDRGGFMMVDDFHNEREWAIFMRGIHQIYPDAKIIEMENDHPAFHVMYDMTNRVRVPGANVVHGSGVERQGYVPHWRALVDSNGRMIMSICFNMDVGDGWEFADVPDYPANLSTEAIRLGVSYAMYAMTH